MENQNWKRWTVAELQQEGLLLVEDGNHGENRPRPNEFSEEGVPFIRGADMDNGQILFDKASKINEAGLKRVRKGIGKPGDILFSHKGTVGKFAFAPMNSVPFVCSPQTTFWRVIDETKIDRLYLYSYLRSPDFKIQWSARKGETDMADYVSLTAQRTFSVPLPPLFEQRAIASILGSLDEKIELNRRQNATLEQMAQRVFLAWFVDFEPVRAKVAGIAPACLDPETAALFPDEFDGDLPLPKSWKVGALADITGFLNGYAFKSADWCEQGVPVVKIGSVKPGMVNLDDVSFVSEEVAKSATRFRLKAGDLLVGMTGYVGEVGIVPINENAPLLNQRVGKFILPTQGTAELGFLYCATRNPVFKSAVEAKSHGSAQANVNGQAILETLITLPPSQLISAFNKWCQPLLDQILNNHAQSRTLAGIRDQLLPRLLSGALRVPESSLPMDENSLPSE